MATSEATTPLQALIYERSIIYADFPGGSVVHDKNVLLAARELFFLLDKGAPPPSKIVMTINGAVFLTSDNFRLEVVPTKDASVLALCVVNSTGCVAPKTCNLPLLAKAGDVVSVTDQDGVPLHWAATLVWAEGNPRGYAQTMVNHSTLAAATTGPVTVEFRQNEDKEWEVRWRTLR